MNTTLVISTTLQERATQLAHVGHQGIEKTKSLLREKIWYPNVDKRVREMVDINASLAKQWGMVITGNQWK